MVEPNGARTGGDTSLRSLAIVIPALNEEAGIERAVVEALGCGTRLIDNSTIDRFQMIVVDDGSSDATLEVLNRLASTCDALTVVRHATNRGLGAAVRSGISACNTGMVFYTDADLPVDLTVVDRSVPLLLEDAKIGAVCAYRTSRRGEGARRFMYSLVYNSLVRVRLGLSVRDVNFASKLLRTSALEGVHLRSEGSFIDVELLARLDRRGHRIVQVPASYHPRSRGVSTLSSGAVIRTIIDEMRELTPGIRSERPEFDGGDDR